MKKIQLQNPLYVPNRLYHGTNATFNAFDLNFRGSNTGRSNTVHGFFFTENIEHAGMFGEQILNCKLEVNNPININLPQIFSIQSQASVIWEILSSEIQPQSLALEILKEEIGLGEIGELYDTLHTEEAHDLMKSYGYDALISHFGAGHMEYAVFNTSAIKIVGRYSRE